MFPKEGKVLTPAAGDGRRVLYAATIARALHSELAGSHRTAKTVMSWTGATERTVKNWLAGTNGPAGEHLIMLISRSDAVFAALMDLAKRPRPVPSRTVAEARDALDRLLRSAHLQ